MTARRHGVCYQSMQGKREQYPLLTIPEMQRAFMRALQPERFDKTMERVQPWLESAGLGIRSEPRLRLGDADTLKRLHELVRAGKYVYKAEPCDWIYDDALATLELGGDCDQWAVTVALAAWLLGFPSGYLVGVGDAEDPYRHVYMLIEGTDSGKPLLYALDPKGDVEGLDFDTTLGADFAHTAHQFYTDKDKRAGRFT